MRIVVGLFMVFAGLGMVGQPWYSHLVVVVAGVIVLLVPTGEAS